MRKAINYIIIFIIGLIMGLFIMNIPAIRYDLNYNGRVDIADFLRYHNYFINH